MIEYQNPAIGEEKSAVDRIKSAIEQQKYNELSKANILKVYDEKEKNQIFGTKEIKEILDEYVIGQEEAKKVLAVAVYNLSLIHI